MSHFEINQPTKGMFIMYGIGGGRSIRIFDHPDFDNPPLKFLQDLTNPPPIFLRNFTNPPLKYKQNFPNPPLKFMQNSTNPPLNEKKIMGIIQVAIQRNMSNINDILLLENMLKSSFNR